MARACSASSNTKLDVRYNGTECSRKGVRSCCWRIASVSKFLFSSMKGGILLDNLYAVGDTGFHLQCFGNGAVFLDRETYRFLCLVLIEITKKFKMRVHFCIQRWHHIFLTLTRDSNFYVA